MDFLFLSNVIMQWEELRCAFIEVIFFSVIAEGFQKRYDLNSNSWEHFQDWSWCHSGTADGQLLGDFTTFSGGAPCLYYYRWEYSQK